MPDAWIRCGVKRLGESMQLTGLSVLTRKASLHYAGYLRFPLGVKYLFVLETINFL